MSPESMLVGAIVERLKINSCDHSDLVSNRSLEAHFARSAIPCQYGCFKPRPPWF